MNEHLNPYNQPISLSDLDLMRINADGTISSSTGYTADTLNNAIIPYLADLQSGAAYLDSSYNVVYYESTEEPEENAGENPGEETTPEEGGEEELPQEPGGEAVPEEPDPGEELEQETAPETGMEPIQTDTEIEGGTT